jgi:hypothetical protein
MRRSWKGITDWPHRGRLTDRSAPTFYSETFRFYE